MYTSKKPYKSLKNTWHRDVTASLDANIHMYYTQIHVCSYTFTKILYIFQVFIKTRYFYEDSHVLFCENTEFGTHVDMCQFHSEKHTRGKSRNFALRPPYSPRIFR